VPSSKTQAKIKQNSSKTQARDEKKMLGKESEPPSGTKSGDTEIWSRDQEERNSKTRLTSRERQGVNRTEYGT